MSESNKARLTTITDKLRLIYDQIRQVVNLASVPEFTTGFRTMINDPAIFKPFIGVSLDLLQTAEAELEHWDMTKDMTDTQKGEYYMTKYEEALFKLPKCTLEAKYWYQIKDMSEKERCEFFMTKALNS